MVEQEIKIKLKAVLEGFDALKQIKSDVKSVFSLSGNGKLFAGSSADAENLNQSIQNLDKSIQQIPAGIAKANQESKGLVSTLFSVISVAGDLGQFFSGLTSLLNLLGISGEQIKQKLVAAFNFIRENAAGVVAAIRNFGSTIASGTGNILTSLRTAVAGLGESLSGALPAIGSAGAGIAAIGITAGAGIGVVLALAAAIAAVVAAVGGISLVGTVGTAAMLGLAKAGFEYNAALEQIELGTGALIAQLSELKQNGIKLEGVDAVNAGINLAQEQLKKLRVDAIQTTATFEQLAQIYQAAVGSGLGAGLNLDEIRQITVQLAQAGAALGVPYDQMRQEISSILEGTIDINSRIAKNLGITNEQVKNWKQQGTLADELNKKLVAFTAVGVKSAQTLNGLKSNLQEALNVFSGEATTKAFEKLKERLSKILNSVFDFKAGGLDKAFKPIIELIDKFLVQGIERFADGIEAGINFAKQLGVFIKDNSKVIGEILDLVDAITRTAVGLIGDFFGLTSTTNGWKTVLDAVKKTLEFINGILIIYRSTQQKIYSGWLFVADAVNTQVIPAVNRLIDTIPQLRLLVNLLGSIASKGELQNTGASGELSGLNLTDGLSYKGIKNPGKDDGEKKAAQIKKAYEDLEKTRLQNAVHEYLAGLKTEEAALKDSYQNRKLSITQYYYELSINQKRAIDAEIVKEQELAKIYREKAQTAKEATDRIQAQADAETAESRILVLQTEAAEKLRELDREKRDSLADLRREFEELGNVLKEFEGAGQEANINRLNEKYREVLERAATNGQTEIVQLIERIKKYETALIKLTEREKDYNNALARRGDALDEISEQLERGSITEEQAAKRRVEIEREYKGELLDVIEAMIVLAQKANDFDRVVTLKAAKRKIQNSGELTTPELLAQERAKFDQLMAAMSVAQNAVGNQVSSGQITPELGRVKSLQIERELRTELEKSLAVMRELASVTASLDDDIAVEQLALDVQQLGVETDTLGKGIIDALRSGLGGLLSDLKNGVTSIGELFSNLFQSILSSIAQLAANELLRSLFASSSLFGTGGALSFLSGLKFAEGGSISGGGTSVSDSIPIMASHGEFMIKAATVKKLGVPFLNWLNNGGNIGRIVGKYATGGAISGSQPMSAGDNGNSGSNGVRIINVIDPALVKDYLNTSAGADTVLNIIKRNPNYIKQILA